MKNIKLYVLIIIEILIFFLFPFTSSASAFGAGRDEFQKKMVYNESEWEYFEDGTKLCKDKVYYWNGEREVLYEFKKVWINENDGWCDGGERYIYPDGSYCGEAIFYSEGLTNAVYLYNRHFLTIDNKSYCFNEKGYKLKGWQKIWTCQGGHWYYFNDNGEMQKNTVIDNYHISFNGISERDD